MTNERVKIRCFIFGIIISSISTWANRYGDVDLWGFHHQISMAVSTFIVALLVRISSKVDFKFVGLYLSIGISLIPIFIISRYILYSHPVDLSFFTMFYILVALLMSYGGSYTGELLLKEEFRQSS